MISKTNRVFIACFALLLVGTRFLSAQTDEFSFTEEDLGVFAPFVSQLRVAVSDPQVRLTWRDAEDLDEGAYQIFRHTQEITQDTINGAEMIAEVGQGVETYLDTPLEKGAYFYAVLASEGERIYSIFVPFRNKTVRSVTVARLDTEEDMAAIVYDIAAQAQENAVVVRFETSRGDRELVVYRSSAPIESAADLELATQIDEFESTTRRFVDYPVPGVAYYYGVFDRALIERGSVTVTPGENTLDQPIMIALDAASSLRIPIPRATERRAPLPLLHLVQAIQSGERLARNTVPKSSGRILGPATEEAIRYLVDRAPKPQVFRPQPVILPEERVIGGTGIARTFSHLISTEFSAGNFAKTAEYLENILTLPLNPSLERRMRFYLGQSLYFDGRIEPAFVEFLMAAEGELYVKAQPWIDGILLPRG